MVVTENRQKSQPVLLEGILTTTAHCPPCNASTTTRHNALIHVILPSLPCDISARFQNHYQEDLLKRLQVNTHLKNLYTSVIPVLLLERRYRDWSELTRTFWLGLGGVSELTTGL